MKLAAFFLAFLIIFLSTQCMVEDNAIDHRKTVSEKSCCSNHGKCGKTDNKDERTCKGMCNPFMVCSGCSFIAAAYAGLHLKLPIIKSPVYTYRNGIIIPVYTSSTWHPPEAV